MFTHVLCQVISEYIRGNINDGAWDELSAEMMNLLSALIGFGFYDPLPKLQDVLIPIIHAADTCRRKHQAAAERRAKILLMNKSNVAAGRALERLDEGGAPTVISTAMLEERFNEDDELLEDEEEEHDRAGEGLEGGDNEAEHGTAVTKLASISIPIQSSSFWRPLEFFSARIFRSFDRSSSQEDVDDLETMSWLEWWYIFSSTLRYLSAVLVIVLVSIVAVILQFTTDNKLISQSSFYAFDIAIIAFFGVEVFLRWLCFIWVRGGVFKFYRDMHNLLDISLVGVDIVVTTMESFEQRSSTSDSENASISKGVRVFRVVRFLRVLRILRAARVLRKMAEV